MSRIVASLAVLAAAAALSACSTVSALNPFGGESAEPRNAGSDVPQNERISILTFEQALTPDPELATRTISVPAPIPTAAWAQPGGTPDNSPVHVGGTASLDVVWRQQVGAGSSSNERLAAPPVIAEGKIFFIDASHEVHAVEAATGRRIWSQRLRPDEGRDRNALGGGIAFDGGRVFVATGFGFVAALDSTTGAQVWRTQAGAPFHAAPTVTGGRVYAVTNDSELVAFDAASGTVSWTYQAIAEPARIMAASSPAVDGDTVIAPFASGEVVALLAANGRRLWVDSLSRSGRLTSLSAINDIAGRPVVDNGVVYAASHSGVLAAIDMRTGQRVWSRAFASTQTPWIAGDVLYAVTVDGELCALDRATGNIYWTRALPRFEDDDQREGRISWSGPILVGGKLVLASSTGQVVSVSPENGEIAATRDLDQAIFIPPVAADGQIVVVTDDARITALR